MAELAFRVVDQDDSQVAVAYIYVTITIGSATDRALSRSPPWRFEYLE